MFIYSIIQQILIYFFSSLAVDCSTLPVDCKTVVADCHEPLKGCIDCWKDPTADICPNECLTGPGPCFYKNDIDVAACIKNNHKLVTKCGVSNHKAIAECAVNKDKSLVTANHCLSCHCA